MTASSAERRFDLVRISAVRRKSGLTGRTAATVTHRQRQLWAVSDDHWQPLGSGCCAASDGRSEPNVINAALRTNGSNRGGGI